MLQLRCAASDSCLCVCLPRNILFKPVCQVAQPQTEALAIGLPPAHIPLVNSVEPTLHVVAVKVGPEMFKTIRHLLTTRLHEPVVEFLIVLQSNAGFVLDVSDASNLGIDGFSLGRELHSQGLHGQEGNQRRSYFTNH